MFLTASAILIAVISTTTSLVLFSKLQSTVRELERTRQRMARLDEVADGLADHEYNTTREEARQRLETPVTLSDRDSGKFEVIGLQFDTEDVFDDEPDFVPPQLATEVARRHRQVPARRRHKTPTGSPQTFAPRSQNSVVEVGSIQVRSENLRER